MTALEADDVAGGGCTVERDSRGCRDSSEQDIRCLVDRGAERRRRLLPVEGVCRRAARRGADGDARGIVIGLGRLRSIRVAWGTLPPRRLVWLCSYCGLLRLGLDAFLAHGEFFGFSDLGFGQFFAFKSTAAFARFCVIHRPA